MFGIDITVLGLAGLVALAAAALAYGVLYPQIETEKKAEGRLRRVSASETDRTKIKAARDRVNEMSKRRKSVQDSLKELEKKQQEKSANTAPSMKKRLLQAGLSISLAQFYLFSALFGLFAFLVVLLAGAGLLIAAGVALIGAAGLPRWIVGSMSQKRLSGESGSRSKTSSEAPPRTPESRHSRMSASTWLPPRPALMKTGAPNGPFRLSLAKRAALKIPLVSGVSGSRPTRKSVLPRNASSPAAS